MKNFHPIKLISIFILFGGFFTKAQTSTYTVSGPIKGQGPLLNTEPTSSNDGSNGWTVIHPYNAGGNASINSWSSAQSIGFPFSFYGSPATHFCVSKNYLLTFDTTVAGTTVNSSITTDNTALPHADLPDHTIAYFWGGFSPPLNNNDAIQMKTFGTTPNRQLWIKNFSYKHEAQGFSYNFVVLEETTRKIYVVNGWWSSQGAGSYTVGVQLSSTTAVQHSSSPNISSINTSGNNNPWPNVDYYEFTPRSLVNDNAGILSLDAPASKTTFGSQSVQVSIKNHGINNLDSVRVNWSVDGVAQTSHSWTGSLAPDAVAAAVNIGSYNFTLGNPTLKIWTSNPNGNPDNDTSNDTLEVSLFVCNLLSGAYTLGGTSSDFPNFDSLATFLSNCGISGSVIIKVAPGTYREQFTLGNIAGVSPTNTIVIDGGDSSLVRLTHDGSTSNATVAFNSTSYVSLRNMTLENTKSSANAWVVHLQNTDHIVIDSCLIEQPVNAIFNKGGIVGSGSLISVFTITTNKHLTVSDNIITGGFYGIALQGNVSDEDVGNHMLRNRFIDIYNYGILVAEQDSLMISGNVIENTNGSGSYGICCQDITDFEIRANNLLDCGGEGIVILGGSSSGTTRSLIANNMIYAPDAAIRMSGFSPFFLSKINIYHNTAVGDPAMEFIGSNYSDMSFYNNIFSNPNGVALKAFSGLPSTIDIDYNLYQYQASRNIAWDGSAGYTNLATWQAAKPALNAHSVEGDPLFVSATSPANLHLIGTLANDTGDNSVGIKVDIDGDSRPLPPSTKVDIGADEYHLPTCLYSSGLFASVRSGSAASLSWVTGGALNWNIEYGPPGFIPGSGTFVYNVLNPYTLSGLTPGTDYDFYVQDSCGIGDVSIWRGPFSFATLCPSLSPATLPLIEDFESLSGTFQQDTGVFCNSTYAWSYETSLAGYSRLRFAVPGFANNGSSAATLDRVLSSGNTAINYLILTIDLSSYSSSSALELEFSYMHHGEENHPNDRVWIRGSNTNSWVQIYDLYANRGTAGIYNQVIGLDIESILANATPPQRVSSTFQVRFGQEDTSPASSLTGIDGYSFDDIAIRETCPTPTNLTATQITQTSATLSWVAGGASNWNLEWDTAGRALGSGNFLPNVAPTPYALSGLIPGTSYQFYVRDSCGVGHVSGWAGPYTFNTLSRCPAPSSLGASNITQTTAELSWITGGASNWDLEYGIQGFIPGPGTFVYNVSNPYTLSSLTPGTDYDFYVRDSCGTNNLSTWVGPQNFRTFSCPSPTGLTLDSIAQTTAKLSWITGGASNWDVEYGIQGFIPGSGTFVYNVSNPYTLSSLTPGTDYDFYVRDSCGTNNLSTWAGPYTFTTLPLPCPSPSSLGASNITQATAELFWITGGASNWDLEYGLSGFPLGSGTRISTTTPSYTVSGLTPGTGYDFYVRDSCGVGHVSSWAGPHTFTTLSATLPCPSPSSLGASNITQTSATLSWVTGGAANWDLEYGLSGFPLGSGTRISTTTPSYTVSGLTPGQSYQFYVRDSCGIAHVSSWAGPDAFTTLSATLPCPSPSSLLATQITQTSARLWWMSGGTSTSNWGLEYGLSGFTLGSGTQISTTTPSYTVSGLTPGRSYQFYVRDSCGAAHVSSWAGPYTFRTLGCLAPTGLKLDIITEITATVSWTSGGASNWNIEYGPINFPLGSGIFLYNVSSPRILRGLMPNTFYDVYVQDSCNVGNVSNWVGPLSVKTIIGIDELLERSFRIYPNPSEGAFKLEFSSSLGEDMEVRITNMMGQIVLEDEIESFSGSYRKRLEMGAYRSGVYLLQLITEKATVNRRIILQ